MQYPSLFFGAFAETGQLEPLDDYFAKYEGTQEYLDWVMPAYREFYTKWAGKTYGVMLDGDIHVLHYRKSYFENKELQDKFSKRFQQNLEVPKNWNDFLKVTQFMTEELKSQGVYGTSMVVNPPNFGWGFWMDIAASAGVNYFDEGMNPTINQGKAAEALDIYKEIVKFGPPGAEAMDIGTTIQRWVAGSDVMSVWWIDLSEFTVQQQGPEKAEDQRATIVPGWKNDDGSLTNRAISLWCRTASIPKNAPAGRQGRGVLLHLPHVASRTIPTASPPMRSAAPIRSASRTTPTPRPRCISKPIRSAAPTTCGPPTTASSRISKRRGTTSTPVSPTSKSATRSSSGKALRNTPMLSAATSRNRSPAS